MTPRLAAFAAMLLVSTVAARAEINVVASFSPVHSLVAGVMKGVGEPSLLVPGGQSPHTYALKPSQAGELEKADIVFWVGHGLEAFLEKPLETVAAKARSVELIDADGLTKLPFREGGPFEKHSHGDDHDGDHAGEEHRDGQGEHAGEEHHEGEGEHEGHQHDETDAHVWLDPQNAKAMVTAIEKALSEADAANAGVYAKNAETMRTRLDALETEVAATVAPTKGKPFIVFHDAYQYFENRFGVPAAGSVTVNPEQAPGAERVAELQKKIRDLGAVCVFSEPQFEPKIVKVLLEGTHAKTGVLDPEGGGRLTPGPDLYFDLVRSIGASLADCLGG